jgi:hypothetical protein
MRFEWPIRRLGVRSDSVDPSDVTWSFIAKDPGVHQHIGSREVNRWQGVSRWRIKRGCKMLGIVGWHQ